MPSERQPVTEQMRALILQRFEEGTGRNAIAREFDIPATRVTTIAREVGHEFDRKDSELAVRLHAVDMAVLRDDLAKAALLKAWDALEQMDAPALMVQFEAGHQLTTHDSEGRESATWEPGQWREHVLDAPTFSDQRNLATIVGIMVTKAAELTKISNSEGAAEATSYIDDLMGNLERVRAYIANDPGSDPTVVPEVVSRDGLLAEYEAQVAQEAQESGVNPDLDATD